jgi:4-amino-4-deoxy-L-arabinose transferase-like glycosyltransferase
VPTPLQLGALVLIVWLPGAVLWRLPWLDPERRSALDVEERLFWMLVLSCGWSLTTALALASANAYTFTRLLAVNALLLAVAIPIWLRRRQPAVSRGVSFSVVLPLVLAVFCWAHFTPAAEYAMGGKDPGTYFNQGIQIAQRGSIRIVEPVVASVPRPARDLFFPQHRDPQGNLRRDYYSVRFMGFRVTDPDTGRTIGQFPHLFPVSIAIGYGLDGLSGARSVTPFWGMLGALAVYFAGARLFGRLAAFAAAGLLALNVVTVWFTRYPNAELVMQAFLFAALLANARAHVDGDRYFAPVAGGLLGLLLFLRFDAVLGVAGICAGLILGMFAGQRPRTSSVATFAVFGLAAVQYYRGPLRAYANQPIEFLAALPTWQKGALALTAAAAVVAVRLASTRASARDFVTRWIPLAIGLLLCGLALYGLYLRQPGGRLAAHDAFALRTYAAFYVTVPAVLAALLGYLLYARRAFWRDPALFATVAVFAAFMFYKIRIVPEHFWAARRFLPVILPATLLFACAAGLGNGAVRTRVLRTALGVVFVALLGWSYARAGAPVADHIEYAGLIPQLERLASQFNSDDLVIVEGRDAQSDVHVMATPLAYVYARNVLVLNSARPDKSAFATFLEWAWTRYRRVLFVGGGGTDLLSQRYAVKALSSTRFQVPEYESALNAYPRYVRRKEFEFSVYELSPPVVEPSADRPFDLDLGISDDVHVLRFHAKEQTEGRTFRWSRANSYISVTHMSAESREVTIVAGDGGRPPAAPPARVDVFLHNQQVGSVIVQGSFKPYTIAIPPDLAARAAAAKDAVELRLATVTWIPARVLGTGDDRALGVMVDRVTIR